jgi:hypothetical protein
VLVFLWFVPVGRVVGFTTTLFESTSAFLMQPFPKEPRFIAGGGGCGGHGSTRLSSFFFLPLSSLFVAFYLFFSFRRQRQVKRRIIKLKELFLRRIHSFFLWLVSCACVCGCVWVCVCVCVYCVILSTSLANNNLDDNNNFGQQPGQQQQQFIRLRRTSYRQQGPLNKWLVTSFCVSYVLHQTY